jgi:arylsulfatase A-like enzyme
LALLTMTGLWLRDATRQTPVNVIFLTVESWRAEAVTPWRMPNLFRAAAEGTHFTQHRAIAAWTAPNIIAVLTGLPPLDQGVNARGQSILPGRHPFLEELSAAGWLVAGLQSFMTIDVYRHLGVTMSPGVAMLPWLAQRARDRRPFVLWHHYLGTHLPYAPAPSWRGAFEALLPSLDAAARSRLAVVETAPAIPAGTVDFAATDAPAVAALYHGGVAQFDAWFGGFWDFFNRSGLRGSTILIVTADHGEELLERGNVGHASTTRAGHLHEEVLRIPLFVWLPPGLASDNLPQTVDAVTDHTDIVPELRRLLGRQGASAARPLFEGGRGGAHEAVTSFGGYAEPDPAHPSGFEVSVLDGPWKLRLRQAAGAPVESFFYNLAEDPGEQNDRAGHDRQRVQAMARDVLPRLATLWQPRDGDGVEAPPPNAASVGRPRWVEPVADGVVRYADIANGARLQWTGDPTGHYRVEYRAGGGALAIDGALEVTGTMKDFGRLGESYWRTWVVPYGHVRLRVVSAARPELASDWLDLRLQP